MRRRRVIASVLVAVGLAAATSLTGSAAGVAAPPSPGVVPAAAMPVVVPEIGVLEDALPPGVRNFLSGVRIIKGLGARNRVYREARHVQRDLRAYYDAQIDTARRQFENREQLGLSPSQVRAYSRVFVQLTAEKQAAMDITEDEKRAAKYGFESALRQEMMSSLIRVPRMRRGLERAKQAIEDLRDGFERARLALEGGNPVSVVIGDLRAKLDKLDRFARVGGLINGNVGATLGGVSKWAGDALDRLEAPIDEATGAANDVIGQLDGLTNGIDQGLESTRTIRADAALEQAADELFERVFAPGGRGGTPEVDVVADAIARDNLTATQRSVGVAIGAIDPSDFRRMRERVHAALLGRSLERIGDVCGRVIGAAHRLELDAAASGEPVPDTSTPCTLFGDPEALQAYIDSQNADQDPDRTTTTVTSGDGGSGDGDDGASDDGDLEITVFEYEGSDLVLSELQAGAGGYYDPRYVFSVSGDQVQLELTFMNHHAWVTGPAGDVGCWAYMSVTYTGETTLARDMDFELALVANGAPRLEGALCEEYPYTWEQEQYDDEDVFGLSVHLNDDGSLRGGLVYEGTSYLEFG